jgi:hypothetical protein
MPDLTNKHLEAVGGLMADTCSELRDSVRGARGLASQWQQRQLWLGTATVALIVVFIVLVAADQVGLGVATGALSLLTGVAATAFNKTVKYWHNEHLRLLNKFLTDCKGAVAPAGGGPDPDLEELLAPL